MAGRILVLDDEENFAEMLKDLLGSHHYLVDVATRPERAMHLIEEIPYDLVVSDYKMPVMDGSDFLKKARELYPRLPFILVSGLMNTPELVKVANMSVTMVMEKPLKTEVFLQHVARFVKPLSDEEEAILGRHPEKDSSSSGRIQDASRFLASESVSMQHALEKALGIISSKKVLYLFDASSGEGKLAAKDLSRWLGNEDRSVVCLEMPATAEEALCGLKSARADSGNSDCIFIRLSSDVQISHAEAIVERAKREIDRADSMLLMFALAARPNPARISPEVADAAVTLPPLADRPLDLATYALRCMKMAAEQAALESPPALEPDAVFEILAFEWPGGLKQVQSVMAALMEPLEPGQSITRAQVQAQTGLQAPEVPAAQRLPTLLQQAQRHFLAERLLEADGDPSELATQLQLKEPVATGEALLALPLIKPNLANL